MDTGAGVVNVFSFTRQSGVTFGDVAQKASTTLNSISALANSTGALTNNGSGTFGYYDYSAILAPKASPTLTGTAAIEATTLGGGKATNNIGALLSVGATDYVDMLKASQTNSMSGDMTLAHATNGVDGVDYTAVRWFFNSSGQTRTVTGHSSWRTNVYSGIASGVVFSVTNNTITRLFLSCGGPTSSGALQTNVYVAVEHYK